MGSIGESKPYIEANVPYVREPVKEYTAGELAQYRFDFVRPLTKVHDIRHYPDFSIDSVGFQLISNPSIAEDGFDDAAWVKSNIYPQTEEAIRTAAGASRVKCFSHLVRRKKLDDIRQMVEDKSVPGTRTTNITPPSPAAHIDHSAAGSIEVLRDNLSEAEAEQVVNAGKRWGIINLWRPLKPVQRDPLCLCDARTVDKEDLVPQRVFLPKTSTFANVSRGDSFESVGVRPNPKHEWYYCSDMMPDEAILLKIHDSASPGGQIGNGVAGGIPHTGLQIPGTEGMPTRESCELRCLVFWD